MAGSFCTNSPFKKANIAAKIGFPNSLYYFYTLFSKDQLMSAKITAAITAVGGYVPEDKLTNFDLEKMVDTNDEWIRSRTGIEERRILKGEGLATSDMVVPAVKDLL